MAASNTKKKNVNTVVNTVKQIEPGNYTINVHIIETRELPPRDFGDTMDPVVQVTIMGISKYTHIEKECLNVLWNHELQFKFKDISVDKLKSSNIKISIVDSNIIRRGDVAATIELDLFTIYFNENHEIYRQWIVMKDFYSDKKKDIHSTRNGGYLLCSISILGPNDKQCIHYQDISNDDTLFSDVILMTKDFKGYLDEERGSVCIRVHTLSELNINGLQISVDDNEEKSDDIYVYIIAEIGTIKLCSKKYEIADDIDIKMQFEFPDPLFFSNVLLSFMINFSENTEDVLWSQLRFNALRIKRDRLTPIRYLCDAKEHIRYRGKVFVSGSFNAAEDLNMKIEPNITYFTDNALDQTPTIKTVKYMFSLQLFEAYWYGMNHINKEYNIFARITVGNTVIYESKTYCISDTDTDGAVHITFDQIINNKQVILPPLAMLPLFVISIYSKNKDDSIELISFRSVETRRMLGWKPKSKSIEPTPIHYSPWVYDTYEGKLNDIAAAIERTTDSKRQRIFDKFDRHKTNKIEIKSMDRVMYTFIVLFFKTKDFLNKPPKFQELQSLLKSMTDCMSEILPDQNDITKEDFTQNIAKYMKQIAEKAPFDRDDSDESIVDEQKEPIADEQKESVPIKTAVSGIWTSECTEYESKLNDIAVFCNEMDVITKENIFKRELKTDDGRQSLFRLLYRIIDLYSENEGTKLSYKLQPLITSMSNMQPLITSMSNIIQTISPHQDFISKDDFVQNIGNYLTEIAKRIPLKREHKRSDDSIQWKSLKMNKSENIYDCSILMRVEGGTLSSLPYDLNDDIKDIEFKKEKMHLRIHTINIDGIDSLNPILEVSCYGYNHTVALNAVNHTVKTSELILEDFTLKFMTRICLYLKDADNGTVFGRLSVNCAEVICMYWNNDDDKEEEDETDNIYKKCNFKWYYLHDEDGKRTDTKIALGLQLFPSSFFAEKLKLPIVNIPEPETDFKFINILILRLSGSSLNSLFGALHPYIIIKSQGKTYETNVSFHKNKCSDFMQFIKFRIKTSRWINQSLSFTVKGVTYCDNDDKQYEKVLGSAEIDLLDIFKKQSNAAEEYKIQQPQYAQLEADTFNYKPKSRNMLMPSYMEGRDRYDDKLEEVINIEPFDNIGVWSGGYYYRRQIGYVRGLIFATDDEDDAGINQTKVDIENLFPPKDLRLRLYVLNAAKLLSVKPNCSADPYLIVSFGGKTISTKDRYIANTLNPSFYEVFDIGCKLPDPHTDITISVWDHNEIVEDKLIGSTAIDIEMRWFSPEWRSLRKKPVECITLLNPTSSASYGKVMLWLDIMTVDKAEEHQIIDIEPRKSKLIEFSGITQIKIYDMILARINYKVYDMSKDKSNSIINDALTTQYRLYTKLRLCFEVNGELWIEYDKRIPKRDFYEGVLTAISFKLSTSGVTELMRDYIQEWSRYNTEIDRIKYSYSSRLQLMQLIAGFIHSSKNPISCGIQIAKWLKKYAQYVPNINDEIMDLCNIVQKHVIERLDEVHSNRLNIIRLESNNGLKIAIESELKVLLSNDSVQLLRYAIWTSEPLNVIRNPITDRINEENDESYAWCVNIFGNIYDSFQTVEDFKYFYLNNDAVKGWWYSPISKMQLEFIFYISFWLFLCYIGIAITNLYQQISVKETMFWCFCASFMLSEFVQIISVGSNYWKNNNNYLDICMSIAFIILFCLRAFYSDCDANNCINNIENIVYLQTWFILLILSTSRVIYMMFIFKSMSLLIKNIIRLSYDILNMFIFILLLSIAFGISLFMSSSVLDGYTTAPTSIRSVIYGVLEGVDWTQFTEDNDDYAVSNIYSLFVQFQVFIFTVFAVLILLNLIIAIMSSTYEDVVNVATTEMQYDRSCITQNKKTEIATVPAPLQFFVYLLSCILYYFFRILSCCIDALDDKLVYILHRFLCTEYKEHSNVDGTQLLPIQRKYNDDDDIEIIIDGLEMKEDGISTEHPNDTNLESEIMIKMEHRSMPQKWFCRYCFCINEDNVVNTKHEIFERFITETSTLPGLAFTDNEKRIIQNVDEILCSNCLRVKSTVSHREMVECSISLLLFHLFCICMKFIILPFHIINFVLQFMMGFCRKNTTTFWNGERERNSVFFANDQNRKISHHNAMVLNNNDKYFLYGTDLVFDYDNLGDSKASEKQQSEMF